METRDWSIIAYNELVNLTSQEDSKRADSIVKWYQKYFAENDITSLNLEKDQLVKFSEYYYMNMEFLKKYKVKTKDELDTLSKLKKFLKH